jgi:transketolase
MGEKKATRDAYGQALVDLGSQDPKIVVLDADLAKSTKSIMFKKAYPNRFFDLGVAEANMTGIAAGLSTCGLIPFMSTFAVFGSKKACDQVSISVCYPNLNVKIVTTHGGITVGKDGPTHQSIEDISIMRAMPNMRVIVPSDYYVAYSAVKKIAYLDGPFFVRLGRGGVSVIYDENFQFELGQATVLREGEDVALMACGVMVSEALEAAELLSRKGIQATVIDVNTVKPIDEETILEAAGRTGAVVTAEEHNIYGGLGSAVAEVLGENLPTPMKRVGIRDTFAESGEPEELLVKYGLKASNIVEAAREVLARKKR